MKKGKKKMQQKKGGVFELPLQCISEHDYMYFSLLIHFHYIAPPENKKGTWSVSQENEIG